MRGNRELKVCVNDGNVIADVRAVIITFIGPTMGSAIGIDNAQQVIDRLLVTR